MVPAPACSLAILNDYDHEVIAMGSFTQAFSVVHCDTMVLSLPRSFLSCVSKDVWVVICFVLKHVSPSLRRCDLCISRCITQSLRDLHMYYYPSLCFNTQMLLRSYWYMQSQIVQTVSQTRYSENDFLVDCVLFCVSSFLIINLQLCVALFVNV